MTNQSTVPSAQALAILKALQDAVSKNLDKKRRLGHYAVIWKDGEPRLVGDDAPIVTVEAACVDASATSGTMP